MAFNSNYLIPNEGLDYSINIFPRGINALPSGTYMGLFTTSWSTIQAGTPNVTLNGSVGGSSVINEASFTNYSRQFIPSGTTYWTSPSGANFTVSGTVSGQITTTNSGYSFTNSGTSQSIYGMFLATTAATGVVTSGTGSGTNTPTVLWYAPFSDLNAVTLATGDSLTVTPTWQFAPNAG